DIAVQRLVFSKDSKEIVTVQALGGTGGLKIGADFLKQINPGAQVWISEPSWENHRQLFEAAGFTVKSYPYYDPKTHGLDFAGMERSLKAVPSGSIVVLHACCHNPTGVDLSREQWGTVLQIVQSRGLMPFLDLAYQGFAEGVEEDAYPARLFAGAMTPVFLSSSFSKSVSLYGERVGALSVVTASADEAKRVLSNLKRVVRTNYSNPPTHGGQVVATILGTPDLRSLWEREVGEMRERIKKMRQALVDGVQKRVPGADWSFILKQRGMFSYSGLTKEQVARLRKEYSIYTIDTGRICVAALTSKNVDYVADAIAKVIR
ncbi:MAG TPA: amino acid aminotransferase, partial [Burkholderiales bacterium]|nr:amino acid aminotransferase [Burkholderiales bacterium]